MASEWDQGLFGNPGFVVVSPQATHFNHFHLAVDPKVSVTPRELIITAEDSETQFSLIVCNIEQFPRAVCGTLPPKRSEPFGQMKPDLIPRLTTGLKEVFPSRRALSRTAGQPV